MEIRQVKHADTEKEDIVKRRQPLTKWEGTNMASTRRNDIFAKEAIIKNLKIIVKFIHATQYAIPCLLIYFYMTQIMQSLTQVHPVII